MLKLNYEVMKIINPEQISKLYKQNYLIPQFGYSQAPAFQPQDVLSAGNSSHRPV